MKMTEVHPGLFIRGRSDQLPAEDKLKALRAAGVTLVVNLWSKPDPDLAWFYRGGYVHYPIPDGRLGPATATLLTVIAARAMGTIQSGGKVLVQCHAGRNRSAMLAAIVVRALTGKAGSEALAAVRAARPNAVANPEFEAYLTQLEAME